jgi:hypothetical protein
MSGMSPISANPMEVRDFEGPRRRTTGSFRYRVDLTYRIPPVEMLGSW